MILSENLIFTIYGWYFTDVKMDFFKSYAKKILYENFHHLTPLINKIKNICSTFAFEIVFPLVFHFEVDVLIGLLYV
jgi:hypothetical protein